MSEPPPPLGLVPLPYLSALMAAVAAAIRAANDPADADRVVAVVVVEDGGWRRAVEYDEDDDDDAGSGAHRAKRSELLGTAEAACTERHMNRRPGTAS